MRESELELNDALIRGPDALSPSKARFYQMAWILSTLSLASMLTFPLLTTQVDIKIEWEYNNGAFARFAECHDIPPGTCCKPQRGVIPYQPDYSTTTFYELLHQQLGAGWAAPADNHAVVANFAYARIPNCVGAPILRVFGSGGNTWSYDPEFPSRGSPENTVFAASWIDLRTRFPPSSAESRYLQWQGVRGAIWGANTWSAESDGIPFGSRVKRLWGAQRLNEFATQGTITINTPVRWVYPDAYEVNGTGYASSDPKKGVYTSKDGKVLNLGTL